MMGGLHDYVQAPGSVLRCPICHAVMMRIVQTDRATRIEMRGIAYFRFDRSSG